MVTRVATGTSFIESTSLPGLGIVPVLRGGEGLFFCFSDGVLEVVRETESESTSVLGLLRMTGVSGILTGVIINYKILVTNTTYF